MLASRKPYQGVWNIVQFNWHFYLIALLTCIVLIVGIFFHFLHTYLSILAIGIGFSSVISLAVSFYIYDCSGLYDLNWLPNNRSDLINVINIHAGFDETSKLIHAKYPQSHLIVLDFYNPAVHTEISIKRARKAYPSYPTTQSIATNCIKLPNNHADLVLVILSAHEIRDAHESILFFKELGRITKPTGKIIVVEHLRDINNFIAYNIGFFHFLSLNQWLYTFKNAQLEVSHQQYVNSFYHKIYPY